MANIIVTGATIPTVANGDKLFFAGGSVPVTGGLNLGGLTSGVALVSIDSARTGDIGKIGSPLQVACETSGSSFINKASGGTLYLQPDGAAADTIELYQHFGTSRVVIAGGGAVTRSEQTTGSVTFGASTTTTRHVIMGGTATVESGNVLSDIDQWGGQVLVFGGNGINLNCYEGKLTVDNSAGSITGLNLYGGSLTLRRSGTITQLRWLKGDIDVSAIQSPITITNTEINMRLKGAQDFLDSPLITFTNAAVKRFA